MKQNKENKHYKESSVKEETNLSTQKKRKSMDKLLEQKG